MSGFDFIGYAPPLNSFERWRQNTWLDWATDLWPVRRGPIQPITYAVDSRVYFLSPEGLYVCDAGTKKERP